MGRSMVISHLAAFVWASYVEGWSMIVGPLNNIPIKEDMDIESNLVHHRVL